MLSYRAVRILPPGLLLVALLAALILSGCEAVAERSRIASSTTLSRSLTDMPAALDPHGPANASTNVILPLMYDSLIWRQADGSLVPYLAESWNVEDGGKRLRFKLRRDIKFHDGSLVTSESVRKSIERMQRVGTRSPIYGSMMEIVRVDTPDDFTVVINLKAPNASILSMFAMPHAAIIKERAPFTSGDSLDSLLGTGLFKLGRVQSGVSITLYRNPDYHWGPPEVSNRSMAGFEQLVFKIVPDASTQLAALQKGDLDIVYTNDPGQAEKMRNDDRFGVLDVNFEGLVFLGFNCRRAPFDDIKVRAAFSHAVDKDQIIETALGGLGSRADALLAPSVLGYDECVHQWAKPTDLVRARALLAEAGFVERDGGWWRDDMQLKASLLASSRAPNDSVATVLQNQLARLGVPVEIKQMDSAAAIKVSSEGLFDLLLWRYEWNDPDGLNMFLGTSRIGQTNRVFYSNPEVDKLFEQGLREFDENKRADLYIKAQKIVLEDAAWQPLYHPEEALLYNKRVNGLQVGALARTLFNDVTLEPE